MIQIPIAIASSRSDLLSSVRTRLPFYVVSNPVELRSFLASSQPRCLLVDSDFPEVDVSKLVSQSRQKHVSTIVLCRKMDTDSALDFFRAGALDVLDLKSVSVDSIEDQVSEILQRAPRIRHESESGKGIDDFVKLARHDLKAPLRTISGFSKLLKQSLEDRLGEEDREYLEFIHSSANKGYELMERLRVFSEIPTNVVYEPVSLEEVALVVSNSNSARVKAGDVAFRWHSAPEVYGNEAALVCLFDELIDNSLKFNRSSVPRVEISSERDGDYWEITVRDNGIGVDESHWQKVFEPLCKLNSESEYTGCGLGLSISKRIVETHGGMISIQSSPERGSEVTFGLIALN